MKTEEILYSMERYGIDFSLISNIEAAENDHQGNPVPREMQKSQNEILRATIAEARRAPGKLGVLPWLKIQQELPDEEFVSLIKENRDIIYGIKIHPFHSITAPDDERMEPVYKLAAEFGLPIASHTGGNEEAMSPHLYNAAKRHPEIDFVMVPTYQTREKRSRFLYVLAGVDAATGERRVWEKMSVDGKPGGLKRLWEAHAQRVLDRILIEGRVPGELHVRSQRVMRFLRPLGLQLPFKLVQHEKLPSLATALDLAVRSGTV